jgi:hypothetical protein
MTAFLDPEQAIPDLQRLIENAILNDPRSLQTALGPSEIGCACDRCLIAMLAGHKADEEYAAWLPALGRAVHEWLELVVIQHLVATGTDRYITEGKVAVGTVGGVEITGNSDVFDTHTGTVIDYKLVGTTSLRDARKNGTKTTYRRQAHLYGRGWAAAGYDVRSVAVWYLPRNGFTIGGGYVHQEPYDEQVALEAIARADQFASWIAAMGADAVTAIAPPHTGQEFSCPDEKADAKAAKQLAGLIQTPDATAGAGSNAA